MVSPQGYAWWYIDATSDDGRHGLTIIAFIGSVFSPYYKLMGRKRPDNHCAINVALCGPRANAWAMTERGAKHVARDRDHFAVGPSGIAWDGDCLTIEINEISAPIPYPVRGRVKLYPELIANTAFALDPAARHRWHPIAPRARIEVEMDRPGISWTGNGYFDSNFGDEPLETGFRDWHWSRAHLGRDVAVLYEGIRRDGRPFDLALLCDRQGRWRDVEAPPVQRLPRSGWLVDRRTRVDVGHAAKVRKTWIDAPFYARSGLQTRLFGEDAFAVHESLSLDRFASTVVQTMLPYRMPRALF
ncbi:hydratase [Sphingomonas sp. S1-29]|uniref:hydratase n=1 Tax=Sphingomonas sp. S1-29 TaxID=2991074 RepID=UPI00223F565E|nr:hydratase [Sphingomonas sp. S1-29]UZK69532.1 hydratase [Sphingomonas sp. S1-29]